MDAPGENDNRKLHFPDIEAARRLFGDQNRNLQRISRSLDVLLHTRGNHVRISGDEPAAGLAENLLRQLYDLLRAGYPLYAQDVDFAIDAVRRDASADLKSIFLDTVFVTGKKRPITPKSQAQKDYIDTIREHDIVFGIGPAGTGKTYLAMAMAVAAFSRGQVNRIVLTRPAVEAGETLGFLPGDLAEKVDPYLRPLYDALHDMMRFEKSAALMQQGTIEVAPLAFMRGRTLNDAFIILDEAQNTTTEQMKMFLTRIGFNSRAVITGDVTQVDLPSGRVSGLIEARDILQGIDGVEFVFFTQTDVVRHRLVRDIILAYERLDEEKAPSGNGRKGT
ncbi:MAG: phosphate starvation-inducible protein PhoH [Desulfobacterales bacterium]|nr:MAG: phosphate starvation-inducible protein PhoH [Desulfobacterales bacterium]